MSDIVLRRANTNDMQMIYEWRNAPEVRKFSFNDALIPWEIHQQWFESVMLCEDKIILIGQLNEHPIGVVRYDLTQQDEAKIDVYLAPGLSGQGIGTKLLMAGIEWVKQHTKVKSIKAEIIPDNIGSLRAFTKAGFEESHRVYKVTL